jgi:hypothetical protein
LENAHRKALALSLQQLHSLKRLAQSWRGFLVALANVAHSKLALSQRFFQVDAQLQIQRLA